MKAETARLLRAVLRLVEDDVRELAECVAEVDSREAEHYRERIAIGFALERRVAALERTFGTDNHSRRV